MVTEEGTRVQLLLQNVEKGKYCIWPHCTLLWWCCTSQLYCLSAWFGRKIRGSLGIHKYYTVSLVSQQLSQHILMDAGLLCNKAVILTCTIKETFCRRPAKSWEENYWPFEWCIISFPCQCSCLCIWRHSPCLGYWKHPHY